MPVLCLEMTVTLERPLLLCCESIHSSCLSILLELKSRQQILCNLGSVLVIVSGSVQVNDFCGRRKFVQTFYLAPQEKAYFVLNDIFHFIDEEQVQHHPAVFLARSNLNSKLSAPTIPEPVQRYVVDGEIQAMEYVAPVDVKQNGPVDNYSFPQQCLQQVPESDNSLEDISAEELNGSLQNTVAGVNHLHASVELPVESVKSTLMLLFYWLLKDNLPHHMLPSIVLTRMYYLFQTGTMFPSQPLSKTLCCQMHVKSHGLTTREEVSAVEDEEEFKKFGELSSEGVVIWSRKDVGFCYCFCGV